MKDLLKSWKVEVLVDKLEEYGYDIDSLQCIDESDLEKIFVDKKFYGPVKRFQIFHSEWIKNLSTLPQVTTSQPYSETNEQNEDGDLSQTFNLKIFVEKNETALALKSRHDKAKQFTHDERLELVKVIADHLVAISYKMSIPVFEEISNQISMVFMYEDKEKYGYRKANKKYSGLLYITYYNRLAAATKKKKRWLERMSDRSEQDFIPSSDDVNDEIKKSMDWMASHNPIDEEDVDAEDCLGENWRYCFKHRIKTIEAHSGDVEEIVKIWPALKNAYGFSMIEDDFRNIFGSKSSKLQYGWEPFACQNIQIIRKMIADPIVKNKLHLLSNEEEAEGTNRYDIEIFLALLHLMEPTTVVLKDNKRFRATIPSSKSRLLKIVEDQALIESHYDLAKKYRENKSLDLFPMIFGIGNGTESVSQFVLRYNEICYTFYTFVEALDAAFKFYIFFKLHFPPEHKRFWALINGIFYKIETPSLEITSSISSYIKSFKI